MPYEFHDTSHVAKRARERRFTVAQAMLTIEQPTRIHKTPPRRGNHGGLIWLFFRAFGDSAEVKTRDPVVEVDTEATAAYVRFSRAKVARTMSFGGKDTLAMVDLDQRGHVIGIEFVGRKDFSIHELLRNIPVQLSEATLNRTRYVTADLQTA
ncbi:MAG: hypothetical protein ABIU29_06510 [Chthoniobacterales bacterium]